jgi:hypothetical protein
VCEFPMQGSEGSILNPAGLRQAQPGITDLATKS